MTGFYQNFSQNWSQFDWLLNYRGNMWFSIETSKSTRVWQCAVTKLLGLQQTNRYLWKCPYLSFGGITKKGYKSTCPKNIILRSYLTFWLWGLIINLAEKFFILHQVELVTGVQFSSTDDASEAFQVVNVVLSSPHNFWRRDWPIASPTLRSKFSAKRENVNYTF